MKQKIQFALVALLLALIPAGALAQTTFFTDTFASSTTNGPSVPGGSPTNSFTSYDIASTKATTSGVKIVSGDLTLKLNGGTTAGWVELQAIFTTNPVVLSSVGDFVDLTVVFTNSASSSATITNGLLNGGTASAIWVGMYDSGGQPPVPGGLANSGLTTTTGSAFATNNAASWQGYISQITSNGTTRVITRPTQNTGSTSADQDLVAAGAGSGGFVSPAGTVIANSPAQSVNLIPGNPYTLYYRLTLTDVNTLAISNSIFAGVGFSTNVVFFQTNTAIATNATFLTGNFDGFSIGVFNKGLGIDPVMDIASIQITGQSTPVHTAPIITVQPVPATVATGGAVPFAVTATGFGLEYQWHRNGTNIANGGNISGATSPQLVISPATSADVASGGYSVTVSGTGGFSTNSGAASLTVTPATSLVWTAASGAVWDLNNTASWANGGTQTTFTYGDNVRFDDTTVSTFITLTGNFLSASSVTVDSESGATYSFSGTGSIAGPGSLTYTGKGQLTLNEANTYSGGTLVSNTTDPGVLYVFLQNYNGLGTGPLVLDNAGGTLESTVTGSATLGIAGPINVLDDFNFKVDGTGTFATVFLSDLNGIAGKTLTINPENTGTTNRIRVYGTNSVFNANLILNNTDSPTVAALYNGTTLAPYLPSGTQMYNGVISGVGGIVQRGNGMAVFSGLNTYTGGTFNTAGIIGIGIDSSPTSGTVVSGPFGVGPFYIAPEVGSAPGTGQVLSFGGAHTIANPIQYPFGTNNHILLVGGTNALTFSGPFTLYGNDGSGSPTNRTLQITNTALTTFTGVISDSGNGITGVFGLTKTGNGVLALNNTETYTGPTTNTAGTLQVNGSLAAASSVVVATNATLAGTGTINGAVSIAAGGILAPGTSSIGTLTINNNLTIAGNGLFRLNKGGSPLNDVAVVNGTLSNTGTGTLTVTNLGTALVTGDKFTLFSKAVANGTAITVTGGGVNWNNNLALDGSISVGSTVAGNSTNITIRVTNNVATLSWPADHLGWNLQAETNAITTGVSSNWVTVPGGSNVITTNVTLNPAAGAVFYRLSKP